MYHLPVHKIWNIYTHFKNISFRSYLQCTSVAFPVEPQKCVSVEMRHVRGLRNPKIKLTKHVVTTCLILFLTKYILTKCPRKVTFYILFCEVFIGQRSIIHQSVCSDSLKMFFTKQMPWPTNMLVTGFIWVCKGQNSQKGINGRRSFQGHN